MLPIVLIPGALLSILKYFGSFSVPGTILISSLGFNPLTLKLVSTTFLLVSADIALYKLKERFYPASKKWKKSVLNLGFELVSKASLCTFPEKS